MLVSRLAHLDVFSPPRSIAFDGARLFRPESDSVAGAARFLPVSRGTCELKIREGNHSIPLRFSPIRLGLPTSLCAEPTYPQYSLLAICIPSQITL